MAKSGRKGFETAVMYPLDWVEERSGLVGYTKWFLFRKVPHDISWAQTLGAASLTAFIVQALTGAGEHGGVLDQDRRGGDALVGAGIGVLDESGPGGLGVGRGRVRGADGQHRDERGGQRSKHGFPRRVRHTTFAP